MPKACRNYCGTIQLRYRRDTVAASDHTSGPTSGPTFGPTFGPAVSTSLLNTGTGGSGVDWSCGCSTDSIDCTSKCNVSNETGRCSGAVADISPSNTGVGSGAKGRSYGCRTDYVDRPSRVGRMYSRDRTSCAGRTVRRQVQMIWLPAILSRRRCRPEGTIAVPLSRRRSRCGIYAEGVP